MKGHWTEVFKCHRNREDYKNQVHILVREGQQKDLEIARLRRKLAEVERYVKEALA